MAARAWLVANGNRVVETICGETGKTADETLFAELGYGVSALEFWAKRAPKMLADEIVETAAPSVRGGRRLKVRYEPAGVVAVIGPWNFPLINSFGDCIPALAAGNAVILKPSEVTPLTSLLMAEMLAEAGIPEGVFTVATGRGETGAALVDLADYVMFTGSVETGKKVMAQAAETLTPVSLELGGKDPMIVLADADLDRAANAAAWGGMMNSGQICMSVERIYVEEPAYDEFVNKLAREVSQLRQGADDASDPKDVGAMTSPNQTAIVEDHVSDALASGARALVGGKRVEGPGDYFEPTVLVDVDHSMKVMRDETFGPVVGVMKVHDAEEALQLANDSRYGLSGSVFGERERAEQVARRVECGAINVNDVLVNYFATEVPMGGWKQSGIGSRHGEGGIKKYCRSESLVITRFGGKREPSWYPYTKARRRFVGPLVRLFNARDWRRRFGLKR
jgi:acyl-CoA reductase-like NAD-dependent aldehyde dehydrogenase